MVLGLRPDGALAARRRAASTASLIRLRQVHRRRRHPGDVHRPAGLQLPAARRARAATSTRRHRRHHLHGRARCPVAFLVLRRSRHRAWRSCCARSRWGCACGRSGSDEESARRLGVHVNRTVVLAYVASRCSPSSGRSSCWPQLGVGDPAQGVGYTLTSITAVVLGGTSLLGGRGTLHRHAARRRPDRPGAQRDDVPRPDPDLAVHLPGRADRRRRRHLQPDPRDPQRCRPLTCPPRHR